MKRRRMLQRIGAATLLGIGVGSGIAAADGVHPDACPICPDWECPDGCQGCWADPAYC